MQVNIIGAGISGLTTGCYLQRNGFDTQIFEKHAIPGGLCTSWQIGEYTFDGCVHWILGTGPGSSFHKIWKEVIDMDALPFHNHEERIRLEVKENFNKYGNKSFSFFTNLDRLEAYMIDLAPEDERPIRWFVNIARTLQKYELPPVDPPQPMWQKMWSGIKKIKYLNLLALFLRLKNETNHTFAARLKNPFLSEVFRVLYDDQEVNLFVICVPMASYDLLSAGYPIGGSLAFAKQIEAEYLRLGGRIHYKTPVLSINTVGDKVESITVRNKVVYPCDILISAADWYYTMFKLLDQRHLTKKMIELKDLKSVQPFYSSVQCSFGIDRDLSHLPHFTRFPLEEALISPDGTAYDRFEIHIYHYDKTLAPKGKTSVAVNFYTARSDYWIESRQNQRPVYRKENQEFLNKVLDILDRKLVDIKQYVEVMDISTPATYFRYTNNWKGSTQGWLPGKNILAPTPVRHTIPGLVNCYLASHWNQPGGGLPIAIKMARDVTQMICKKYKKQFKTRAVST